MLGYDEKMLREKILLKNFKELPNKLEKGHSQDLVKQTLVFACRPRLVVQLSTHDTTALPDPWCVCHCCHHGKSKLISLVFPRQGANSGEI